MEERLLRLIHNAISDGSLSLGLQTTYLVTSLVLAVGCGLLLLYLVWKKEYLHKPRHYLRCNLAVDDIIFTGCSIPVEICWLFSQDNSNNQLLCGIQHLVGPPSVASMFGTYLLMAVELYYFICRPLSYNDKVTTKRVIIGIGAARAFALFFGVGPVVIKRLQNSENSLPCDPDQFSSTNASAIFRNISQVGIVLAVLAIFILYCLIYREARKQQERDENRNLWLYQTKAFKTLAPHVAVLAISATTLIFHIAMNRVPLNGEKEASASLLKAFHAAKLIFMTVSSMANPIIYSFRQPEFRRALRELCGLPTHHAPVLPPPTPPRRRGQDMEMAIFRVRDQSEWTSDGESSSAPPPSQGETQHGDQAPPSPAQTQENTRGQQASPPKGNNQGMVETPSNSVQTQVIQLQADEAPLPKQRMAPGLGGRPMLLTVSAEVHRSASPPPNPAECHELQHMGRPEQHKQEMKETFTPTPEVQINLEVISLCGEEVATSTEPPKLAWCETSC